MQQGVQTDATCNIEQYWELLANNVASVCTGLWGFVAREHFGVPLCLSTSWTVSKTLKKLFYCYYQNDFVAV